MTLRYVPSFRSFLFVASAVLLLLTSVTALRGQTFKSTESGWQSLFDGKSLANWEPTKFFGQGSVTVENGQIILEAGKDLTGITWTGPALPATSYEITLQAMRVAGNDFFAGVTFPVDDSFCSLILGGWGGQVIGLSSLNGMDASENETSQSAEFEAQRWYTIRIRVTPAKIETWLDDKQIINQNIKGNKVHTRPEMDPSKPLGVASWRTKAALRDLRLRRL
jgi:3-keto-disaccharide hydrolase